MVQVREIRADDAEQWRRLYRGYVEFYQTEKSEESYDLVWGWLMDPDHELGAYVAEVEGRLVGIAHWRPFVRPLNGSVGCYLDDLFVEPEARGSGVADALLARLRRLAAERGWSVVRWITAEDNYRARARYDRIAERTPWVTYDMRPE
ncbi:acetyltransferase (GNAT) family protein [Diaminobutyricimonas aerilata]|uniref:Acetyltransferase (GNAT) family protein n=1 Tax=Diaminobutyricimonas aerilata TaxID=1162967 RepID=A0A2M9CIJ6_9MICO|nr:GNAT family N-acetyltransferase [Diaminobutyricimonas aerilata]PJJ71689.1 acetyltransferase (GNAT) family protein [Diaminobutyricimonas aerilata]